MAAARTSIERILCPIDFSDTSHHALAHAAAIARWYEARLSLLYVFVSLPTVDVPPVMLDEDDRERLIAQMREFASRTHQDGTPELAREYLPAEIDLAAMPIRVEKWRVSGAIRYRVVGIQWGGAARTDQLDIRFGEDPWQRVCIANVSRTPWALWEHEWRPAAPGVHAITLRTADPSIRTRRLDTGYYLREVEIDEI